MWKLIIDFNRFANLGSPELVDEKMLYYGGLEINFAGRFEWTLKSLRENEDCEGSCPSQMERFSDEGIGNQLC
jgi:hypothetical protein